VAWFATAATFTVWIERVCDNCSIYIEGWNSVHQDLYLQRGVEYGATASVSAVRSGKGCDNYCIYCWEWNSLRQQLYLE